jgi:hypothetical protein
MLKVHDLNIKNTYLHQVTLKTAQGKENHHGLNKKVKYKPEQGK